MAIIHVCDICGAHSPDEALANTCSEKGRKNKYEKGQKVRFKYTNTEEDRFLVTDTIIKVTFAKGTHAPSYVMSYHGGVITVPESDVIELVPDDTPLKFFKVQHYNTEELRYWQTV